MFQDDKNNVMLATFFCFLAKIGLVNISLKTDVKK